MKRIIVAVTGASGAVYARKVAERLLRSPQVAQVAVVCSANGRKVMEYERERLPEGEERMVWFDNDDLFAPPASGSAGYDGMVIVPCTMGSAGRIAAGISGDLIGRDAEGAPTSGAGGAGNPVEYDTSAQPDPSFGVRGRRIARFSLVLFPACGHRGAVRYGGCPCRPDVGSRFGGVRMGCRGGVTGARFGLSAVAWVSAEKEVHFRK